MSHAPRASRPTSTPLARLRATVTVLLSVGAPITAWAWQVASVHEGGNVLNTCSPALRVDPVGGWIVPALLAAIPVGACLIAPRGAGKASRFALGLAMLSGVFFVFFWWQLLPITECEIPDAALLHQIP